MKFLACYHLRLRLPVDGMLHVDPSIPRCWRDERSQLDGRRGVRQQLRRAIAEQHVEATRQGFADG